MVYGTAPRQINGVWRTRTGRRLSAEGQQYWSRLHAQGRTDGFGHMVRHAMASPKAKSPTENRTLSSAATYVRPGTLAPPKETPEQRRQRAIAEKSKRVKAQQEAENQARTDKALFGQALPAVKASAKATRLNPIAAAVIKGISPGQAVLDTASAIRKHRPMAAAVSAAGIIPFGPKVALGVERAVEAGVAASRGEKAVEAGLAGRRTLRAGEKVQQLQGARSRITRTVIEKPADKASQAMMGEGRVAKTARKILPTGSAQSRVAKHAGRETRIEGERAQAAMVQHLHALPKEGSNEDVAHFWWAQLPKSHRNVEGLQAIRHKQIEELGRIESGAKQQALGKKRIQIAGLPQQAQDLRLSIASLDKVIAKSPKVNEKIIGAVHALSGDRQKVLEEAGLLTPERAQARSGILSDFIGLKPTGEEAFIGHRLPGGVRGKGRELLPISPGTGRPAVPEGVSKANKLVRVKTGAVRTSTKVAAEDWQASQTYRHAVRAREDLAAMGKPFDGTLDRKTEMLVNPKGRPVPAGWKTDKLAQLVAEGHNEDEIRKAADEINSGFLSKPGSEADFVKQAQDAGVNWSELRVVPKNVVERYYGQFTPARTTSTTAKVYDRGIDAVATNLIFARVGYVPKNIAQNLIMAAPHQGSMLLANLPRAGQVLRDETLRHLISQEVGQGATGAIAQEAASKVLGAPAKLVSGVADTPLRISAFLHEAAAEKVIPKLNPVLSQKDRQALIDLLTHPEQRAKLNDVRQRSVEAMADFSRMTPTQRKWARRFLIIPGWLMAGSRYPVHFAATHPLRSAALGYIAAGEPGSPVKTNKPINKYFAKGLPSYLQGIKTGKKVLRTQSISPVNTPWDIAGALIGRSPQTAVDYANPLPTSLLHTLNREVTTPSGETKKVGYEEAAKRNLFERLLPSVSFAQQEISPPSGDHRLYPDTSRLGRLARESGVVPVKINQDAAERAAMAERGMTRSVGVITDKTKLYDRITAAKEKPSKLLDDAYALRLERSKRLDKIHAHGLTYQQRAYKADVGMLVEHGLLSEREAKETLAAAKGASEEQLKSWRTWFGKHKFGGETIGDVKHWLHGQGK